MTSSNGETSMRALIIAITLVVTAAPAFAKTAIFKRDFITGTNRVCVYDFLGQEHYITIPAVKLCPPTIKV